MESNNVQNWLYVVAYKDRNRDDFIWVFNTKEEALEKGKECFIEIKEKGLPTQYNHEIEWDEKEKEDTYLGYTSIWLAVGHNSIINAQVEVRKVPYGSE